MISKAKRNRRIITALLFIVFSSILFINNLSQLLSNWMKLSAFYINIIAWTGIIGSVIYTIWKVSGDEM